MLDWQVLWTRWHFGYRRVRDEDFPDYELWHSLLFIGPFQFHWYS